MRDGGAGSMAWCSAESAQTYHFARRTRMKQPPVRKKSYISRLGCGLLLGLMATEFSTSIAPAQDPSVSEANDCAAFKAFFHDAEANGTDALVFHLSEIAFESEAARITYRVENHSSFALRTSISSIIGHAKMLKISDAESCEWTWRELSSGIPGQPPEPQRNFTILVDKGSAIYIDIILDLPTRLIPLKERPPGRGSVADGIGVPSSGIADVHFISRGSPAYLSITRDDFTCMCSAPTSKWRDVVEVRYVARVDVLTDEEGVMPESVRRYPIDIRGPR